MNHREVYERGMSTLYWIQRIAEKQRAEREAKWYRRLWRWVRK